MGFPRVYRYAPGKADWRAAGLPMEGTKARQLRAIDVVRRDPPTCRVGDPVGEAARAAEEGGLPVCLVLNDQGIVVGRLRRDALGAERGLRVEKVMEEGPTTIRADEELAKLVERMQRRKVGSIVVTDPDGRLIGILYRADAESVLAGRQGGRSQENSRGG